MEHDTMGQVAVPADKLWGAQTQRSFENFPIGEEKMPADLITAFGVLKEACAAANHKLGKLDDTRYALIQSACQAIRAGELADHFPLAVWQTGSGTYTTDAFTYAHNDTFPTALHIAAVTALYERLFPAIEAMLVCLERLEQENAGIVKTGRTHLQDAVPISFGQEISGWRSMVEHGRDMIRASLDGLYELALGGTAVGTGLNAPAGFGEAAAEAAAALTGLPFRTAPNKFHALTAKDALTFSHGALKALAANLMKIANDVRWLASGPRCGLGEIFIPENEPGSSIMPGKVNPTQCEALTMVAVQVMGNDAVMGIAASQGNFELNVYMPVMAYNYLQSVRLLADGITSFTQRCLKGLTANREKMADNLHRSLMTVTALTPIVGYENGAKIAKKAHKENISLKEAAVALGLFTPEDFDAAFHPEAMA